MPSFASAGRLEVLAAEADDLGEKWRCLEAILELDPNNEQTHMARLWVLQEQQRRTTRDNAAL